MMAENGREPFALACEDGAGNVLGMMPLLSTRGLPINLGEHIVRRRLSSLPRTPVAGPLSTSCEATRALVQAAIELARDAGMTFQMKTPGSDLEGSVDGLQGAPWKPKLVVSLPRGGTGLRFGNARQHGRVMYGVNKARKLGVRVRWSDTEEELRSWYQLYLDTMRWHASLSRPYRFFQSLWRSLHPCGLMRLLVACREVGGARQLLAGCVYLISGRGYYCWLNGRRRDQLHLCPNDAIHWEGISTAWKEGFEWYDFGEVEEDQKGLIAFKSKWGAEPTRSYRYYFPAPKGLRAPAPESNTCSRLLLKRLWRRVPLPLTELAGDWACRYL